MVRSTQVLFSSLVVVEVSQAHSSSKTSFSKKGSSSSTLNPARQRRADTGVWPCTLDGCTKVFAREADLKRHQRTTKSHLVPGSGVGSPCPLCDATFTRTDAMRRHLKSRHNGKTPETLHHSEVSIGPLSSSGKGKRRPRTPSDTSEFSFSDGEQLQEADRSASSSRGHSTAPPYYEHDHPAPPPPQTTLSPSILYQAALSYEIQHALSPSMSPSSPSVGHLPSTSALRTENEDVSSPRVSYHQPHDQGPFSQYPNEQYTYSNQHPPYVNLSHPHPQQYPPGPGGAGHVYSNSVYPTGRNGQISSSYGNRGWSPEPSPDGVKLEDMDVSMPANQRARGRRADHSPPSPFAQHEPIASGLVALAMHAARTRPMSPLPAEAKQQGAKTKSELESALGPSYTR